MNTKIRNILLAVILGVGFLLRFAHGYLRHIISGITFITPDPYYHVRRIVLIAQHFPHLPSFDYYLSYPTGARCIWPPLFDFLCATLAYIIGFSKPSVELVEFVAAVYPIIYALAVVLLTYFIGRKIFNEYVGIIAAAIVSFLPANVILSNFGFTDHHIAESFSLVLIFYVMLQKNENLKKSVLLGISIGVALLLWQGSIFFAGIVCLYLYFSKSRYKYAFVTYLVPIVMIFPFSLGSQYIGGYFTHRGLSLLYIVLLGIAGVLILLKYLIINKKVLYITSGVVLLIFVGFLFPQLRMAFHFVTKNVWTQTIVWYQSIISLERGYLQTSTIQEFYGRFYFVWPIIVILVALNKRMKEKALFIYLTIVIGLFSFFTTQYSIWFVPFYALLLSYFLYLAYDFLSQHFLERLKLIIAPVLGIIIFIIFQPIFINYRFTFENMPSPIQNLAYTWLRDSTEATSYFTRPAKEPDYGVMNFYGHGHMIIYIGQRPAIGNNFGKDAPNFDIANKFMLSKTEEEANELLSSYNARYIYCYPNLNEILLAARFLNHNPRDYFEMYATVSEDGEPTTALTIKLKTLKTFYYRLMRFNGCRVYVEDSIYIEPIRHSRLVYVSPSNPSLQIPIKIFEFVKGAKIAGRMRPHNAILFLIPVNFPYEHFVWADSLMSDAEGNFIITSPYATDTMPAIVVLGTETTTVYISDDNVVNGDTLLIP